MQPGGLRVIDAVDNFRVPVQDVPVHFRDALLTMEDRRFYEHPGIDVRGMARAVVARLIRSRSEGGSTITQQLAKNVFLSGERSFWRKARELILALKIEAHYIKDEILAACRTLIVN